MCYVISVVCVYNDLRIFEKCLRSSIQSQTGRHELITLDNTDGHFRSAAQAMNQGGRKANGAFIMFAHQDVSWNSNDWLERAEEMLKSLPNLGIAGVAGRRDSHETKTAITHGDPSRLAGHSSLSEPVLVQTVDECLFFIPAEVFSAVKFDEQTCDAWHLYSVDYSLSIQERGFSAYVIPLSLHHESMGHASEEYFAVLERVVAKHRTHYRTIHTTIGSWNTLIPVRALKLRAHIMRVVRDSLKKG